MSMTIEERLKELVLAKYHSVREFTLEADLPYSTFTTMMKRGIFKSHINNILKMCATLNISADALADGEIVPLPPTITEEPEEVSTTDEKPIDVYEILENTKKQLLDYEGLMFHGKPADQESINSILNAMEIGVQMALRNRK